MPEYKQLYNGGQDQAVLKDKTIVYEPSELRQLNTLGWPQHDHRLKVLPFGAIRKISELRINCKKIKSSIQNRIKATPNGINNKNIVWIQQEGTKPQVNFTIATCNIQSLKNKELQVSELISDYSIDTLVITETWLKAKDDHWKNTTSLNGNNLKLSTADQAKGKGGGIALITKNHYQVNLVARHNSRLNSFECTTWKITAKEFNFHITLCVSSSLLT